MTTPVTIEEHEPALGDETARLNGEETAACGGSAAQRPQAAVQPDGTVVMLLSPSNPYATAAAAQEVQPVQEALPVDPAVLEQFYGPLQLERMARIVRLLALFDIAFSVMHAMTDMWPAALAAVMSYSGYMGAKLFRRDLTRVYLLYLILFALARVALAIHFLATPLPASAPASLPIYLSLTSLFQLLIAHFVWRFYSLLPTTLEQARFVQYVAEQHAMMVHQHAAAAV